MNLLRGAWAFTWRFLAAWLVVRVILALEAVTEDYATSTAHNETGTCRVCGAVVFVEDLMLHEGWHHELVRAAPKAPRSSRLPAS